MNDMMYYKKVKALIKNDPDLLEKLTQVTEPKFRSGPKTPDFAFGRQKEICYLSGISSIYLRKLARGGEKVIQTKSQILEQIIRSHFEMMENTNKQD